MERVCFQLRVRPDRLEEYKARHAAVWPDMLHALAAHGWHNYSLFLRPDGLLIGYFETPSVEAAQTGMDVYFADPRSPWQRGTNENTNRLLRQYLPRGVNMGGLNQADLDTIAARLNNRPRKVLGYDTPAERLATVLTGDPHRR